MYDGKGITVWNLPPDPQTVIDAGKLVGADWVEFKVHDGASAWGGNRHVDVPYVSALRRGFARVNGWGYCYCDGLTDAGDRGDGVPELEAATATAQMRGLGLDAYSGDFEIECEGHADLVERFCDALDAGWQGVVGGPVNQVRRFPFYAVGWPNVSGHGEYPFSLLGRRADGWRPMIYRPEFSVWGANPTRTFDTTNTLYDTRHYFTGKPVSPIVSLYVGNTPSDEFGTDLAYIRDNCAGISAWELGGLSSPAGRAFAALTWGAPAPERPIAAPPQEDPAIGAIWNAAGDLVNRGDGRWLNVQRLIRYYKGEITRDDFINGFA